MLLPLRWWRNCKLSKKSGRRKFQHKPMTAIQRVWLQIIQTSSVKLILSNYHLREFPLPFFENLYIYVKKNRNDKWQYPNSFLVSLFVLLWTENIKHKKNWMLNKNRSVLLAVSLVLTSSHFWSPRNSQYSQITKHNKMDHILCIHSCIVLTPKSTSAQ